MKTWLCPILLLLSPLNASAGTEVLTGEDPLKEQADAPPNATWPLTASVTLDDIVVKAEREGPAQTDTALVRIDREEVRGSLSKGVAEALQRDPGIFRFRNGRGEQSILMRGSNNVRSSCSWMGFRCTTPVASPSPAGRIGSASRAISDGSDSPTTNHLPDPAPRELDLVSIQKM